MKKIKLFILILVLITGISTAFPENKGENNPKTVTFSGKVTDQANQEALAGALIRIEGTDFETYTDLEGNFCISGLIPDTYKVKCSFISYSDREEEIHIGKNAEEVEISLQNVVSEQTSR